MRKRGVLVVVILLILALVSLSLVYALTTTLQMNSTYGNDTYIWQDKATTNYGNLTIIEADSKSDKSERILLFFNLSSLPSSSIIYNATLELYLSSATGASFNLSIYRLTRVWTETGVTWNTYNGTNPWNSTGGDYDSNEYSKSLVNLTVGWKFWNMTRLVQELVNETYTNYGFILVPQSQTGDNYKRFNSRENFNQSITPRLIIDYIYDTTPPNLTIISPLNQSYNNATILVNISASDSSGISGIWWYNGTANLTYTNETYYIFPQGSNTIIAYANDTLGNLNQTSRTFYVDSLAPSLDLISPSAGATYGYNTSLNLNYTALDANLQACWYSLNGSVNITLSNCQNTTFNASDGGYTLRLYANDSFGNLNSASANFSINTAPPSVVLYSPIDVYLAQQSVEFNYTPSDISLQSCELWGNFDGAWKLNQTKNNPSNYSLNHFYLNLIDGAYLWNVRCNDSQGNSAGSGDKTFTIDTTFPLITISQPSGAKTSRTGIQASWVVSDANFGACWYNVYRGGSAEIANTSISCSINSTTFDVTVDADFTFNFYVSDSAGNFNFSSSSFSVSTGSSSGAGSSSGDGSNAQGGGSVLVNATKKARIEISNVGDLVMNPGETKTLSVTVKNIGNKFLNNCKMQGDLISSKESKGLSPGEVAGFIFSVSMPSDASEDKAINLSVICNEIKASQTFKVLLIKESFTLAISSIEQNGKKFNFIYNVKDLSNSTQNISVEYWIQNAIDEKIAEGSDSFRLGAGEELEKTGNLTLPSDASGEYTLAVKANSQIASSRIEETIMLGRQGGLIGRAIMLSENGYPAFIIILIIIGLALLVIVAKKASQKRIYKEHFGYEKVSFKKQKLR